jgi:uncharacterized protein YkwD
MLRRILVSAAGVIAVSAFVAVAWTVGGTADANALSNCDTTEAGITAAEQQMLTLINGARASAGVPALKLSPNLNRAAAWKSADPSATGSGGFPFSHTDSLGRGPYTRAPDCGYAAGAAENIAYGSTDPLTIFNMWMASSGHRANILMASYVVIGIGQHGTAWTTDFGYIDDSGATAPPPATATQPAATATQPAATATQPAVANTQPAATATNAPSATASPSAASQPSANPRSFHATVPQLTHD